MNNIYVCGDTHWGVGDEQKVLNLKADGNDIVIICGDFGALWNQKSNEVLDLIERWLPFTICFVDGNHENFEMIYSYPVETWNKGKIHRIRKNIIHLCRGELFEINGKTFFTFGGGYSLDKAMREEHKSWWKEELPNEEEYAHGMETLSRVAQVDYIISHAGPEKIVYQFMLKLRWNIVITPEEPLKAYFQKIADTISFDHWYFGHYHFDMNYDKYTCLYHEVIKL